MRFKSIMLICLLVIFTIPTVRFLFFDGLMGGESSYYHQTIAESLPSMSDATPYHYLLSFFHNLHDYYGPLALSLVLMFLSVILLYGFFLTTTVEEHTRVITLFLIILSPGFLYLSSTSTQFALAFFLLCFTLYFKDEFISLFSFSLLASLGVVEGFLALLILMSFQYYAKNRYFYVTLLLIGIFSAYSHSVAFEPLPRTFLLRELIADFGGLLGISIFILLLSLLGLYFSWSSKKNHLPCYIAILLLLFSFIVFSSTFLLFLFPLLCFYAAIAVSTIVTMNYEVSLIRDFTIIVIFCGILFTTLSYGKTLSTNLPDEDYVLALEWLERHSLTDDIVFSHPSRGFWIEYFSHRSAFSTTLSPNPIITDSLFYSQSLLNSTSLLYESSIDYILIDKGMKEEEVWKRRTTGLLYLLANEQHFAKIYSDNGIDIYSVLGSSNITG